LGAGATVETLATFTGDTVATVASQWEAVTIDGGSQVQFVGTSGCTGAGTSFNIEGGTAVWNSTGTPLITAIGSGGTLNLEACPAVIAIATVEMQEGSALRNKNSRITLPVDIELPHTGADNVTIEMGTNYKMTFATL
ncbi:hypothetical protein, partial [Staphylococcus aureus]|uniref:hypothetical protein n=1 Tax=Staphylococcus aureus TaxID=1280 RepID=UPI0039BE84AB